MATEKTELEWVYNPADLFEAPYTRETDDYVLVADGGVVRVTLRKPCNPIDATLQSRITNEVEALIQLRKFHGHRSCGLGVASVNQYYSDGTKWLSRSGAEVLSMKGELDTVLRNASGAVVQDSKSERIAEHTNFIDSVMPKLASSSTLKALLESYDAAVSHPTSELVHLYEILDALGSYYGGKEKARRKLQIPKREWQRLSGLANDEPLKEGRHRGSHSNLRHATTGELDEAREIASHLIKAFAAQV
jgi:hypothetical protein